MRDTGAYGMSMAAAALRLLTLIALMLMPVGMAGAPALAQPAPVEHAGMAMGEGGQGSGRAQHGGMAAGGHCDEMPVEDQAPSSSKMDCAAMCTALPAGFGPAPQPMMKLEAPRSIAAGARFNGIVLEIATPPPRRI